MPKSTRVLLTLVLQDAGRHIIEKRRAIHLFEEGVRSFPITNTLFSRKEHLLVYKHRNEIIPDIEGKKFLFVNSLAFRGPCFHWLKREDRGIIIAWAEEFLRTSTDEVIKKNALRFLIENSSSPIKIQTILENFDSYEDKDELSKYIGRFAKAPDRNLLLKSCTDKREEVALQSQHIVAKMFPEIDQTLTQIAASKSNIKRKLLRLIINNLARKEDITRYRGFVRLNDKPQQIIYIYCLGEVGTHEDLRLLSDWIGRKRRNKTAKIACWYSISRIANRLGNCKWVLSLINKRNRDIRRGSLEAMTRDGIGANFKALLSREFINGFKIGEIILEIAAPGDIKVIRSYLAKRKLDYDVRDLVLAICKIGDSSDFQFLFNLFGKYRGQIEFHNHVRIADSIAKMCNKRQASAMKKFIKSGEFWSYIFSGQQRPKRRFPIEKSENQAFMRRIIGACFIEKAGRSDIGILMKLLHHNYKWIA